MFSNVVISEVDALMYVVLSKAEQHVPYGKLVGTTECLILKSMCHTNRGSTVLRNLRSGVRTKSYASSHPPVI